MNTTSPDSSPIKGAVAEVSLRRTLKLWDLVIYGIILISPTAALPLFGVVNAEARGHIVTTLLIAMVAMLFTAISYGRMASAYPTAGSAFTYVGRELDRRAGYLVGWSMVLDYILCPILCVTICSKSAGNILPVIPFWAWAVFFAGLFTTLNLRGIKASSRTNALLAGAMVVVVMILLLMMGRYLLLHLSGKSPAFFLKPFYDPATFSFSAVLSGTSIAVLTYVGFDGISTLSEEVENPRRNVLLATVLTCLFTGLFSGLQIYAGQLVWPYASGVFPDVVTAYVKVSEKAGGPWLGHLINFVTFLVASVGSGLAAQLALSRLLYSMGRDEVIPKRFFGRLSSRTQTPVNNVILTGGVALAGALFLDYDMTCEMMNFGALIAFMGVNIAALVHYSIRGRDHRLLSWLPSVLGTLICFLIWLGLGWHAKLVGGLWLFAGLVYGACRKGGFRVLRDIPI